MKISKLSLISLSLLLCQATMPMAGSGRSILKKVQKAGKIALKIGAGTATLGMYTLMGTATLASLGLTIGAASALPYLYYARYIKPKLAIPAVGSAITAAEAPEIKIGENVNAAKRPHVIPQKSQKSIKNRASMMTKAALKSVGVMGVLTLEQDTFVPETIAQNHMSCYQMVKNRVESSQMLHAQLADCHTQQIEWQKEYNRARILEFPRFEGAYQDMIGIIDSDVQDVADAARNRMHADLDAKWQQVGCKDTQDQLAILARRIQQDSMRLPKL